MPVPLAPLPTSSQEVNPPLQTSCTQYGLGHPAWPNKSKLKSNDHRAVTDLTTHVFYVQLLQFGYE